MEVICVEIYHETPDGLLDMMKTATVFWIGVAKRNVFSQGVKIVLVEFLSFFSIQKP